MSHANVHGRPRSRRVIVYVLLAILLALLILVTLPHWRSPSISEEPVAAPKSSSAQTARHARTARQRVSPAPAPEEPAPATTRHDIFDNPTFKQHSPAPVRVVGQDGKPMAAFPLLVSVLNATDFEQRRESLRRSEDAGALMAAAGGVQEFVTDDEGFARIDIPSYGYSYAAMLVAPGDWSSWNLSGEAFQEAPSIIPGVCELPVRKRPQVVTLIAARTRHFALPISFADGQPFFGRVHIMLYSGAHGAGTAVNLILDLDDASVLTFVGVEDVARGTILCTSARRGFRALHSVSVGNGALDSLSAIVIPAVPAESQAGLVVDLAGFDKQDGWVFSLLVGTSGQGGVGVLRWGKEYRTLRMDPRRGPYTARLEGKHGQVWDSGPITPVAGKIIYLVPEVQEGCAVRCTVVSEDGAVLFPAFATIAENQIPLWDWFRNAIDGFSRSSEGFSYGNSRGMVQLESVPPSVRTIYVEAEGYERVAVPVVLSPGQPFDLGELRLRKAFGKLTVGLVNYDSAKDVVAVLRGADGKIFAHQAFRGSETVTFEALAFRQYRLQICSSGGTSMTTIDALPELIELASESPEKVVRFYRDRPYSPPPPVEPK